MAKRKKPNNFGKKAENILSLFTLPKAIFWRKIKILSNKT